MSKIAQNSTEDIINKFYNYSYKLIENLLEELLLNEISTILISGTNTQDLKTQLKKFFPSAEIEICTEENINMEDFYDLIISFHEYTYLKNPQIDSLKFKKLLKKDGVIIGCFLGEGTLMETRLRLWEIEERITGKYSSRIIPMIRLQDFTSFLQHMGFKNVVTFLDELLVPDRNLITILQILRVFKEKRYFEKIDIFPKTLFKAILEDKEKYQEKLHIISFCASKTTKLFATQQKL